MRSAEAVRVSEPRPSAQEALAFPTIVDVSLAYICNSRCPNCLYNIGDIRSAYRDAMYMEEHLFHSIADQCGPPRAVMRISGGGEPMLHPKAVDLISYAKNRGARVWLVTNGSRFSPQSMEDLLIMGVDVIEFSADAENSASYMRIRPGLDWDLLVHNVKTARKLRDVLHAETRIIASVVEHPGLNVSAAKKHWMYYADDVTVKPYRDSVFEHVVRRSDSFLLAQEPKRPPCPRIFNHVSIDSRGDVTSCSEDVALIGKVANVLNQPLKDIWNGSALSDIREKHKQGRAAEVPICSQCRLWERYKA